MPPPPLLSLPPPPRAQVLEQLHAHPARVVPIVLARLRQKAAAWEAARGDMQGTKRWRDETERAYGRSLDHRAFYFARAEKRKVVSNKFLVDEIKELLPGSHHLAAGGGGGESGGAGSAGAGGEEGEGGGGSTIEAKTTRNGTSGDAGSATATAAAVAARAAKAAAKRAEEEKRRSAGPVSTLFKVRFGPLWHARCANARTNPQRERER